MVRWDLLLEKVKKKKKRKKIKQPRTSADIARAIILIICIAVFCGACAKMGTYVADKVVSENDFEKIRVETGYDLSKVYKKNHDFIGWLRVDGTRIDYPVMCTPKDPELYLHKNFEKEDSVSGTPFMDVKSLPVEGEAPPWNKLIYGHNMKAGTMFHDLQKFENKDFWKEHKYMTFDTYDPKTGKTEQGLYEIFAVCRTHIKDENDKSFKYYQYAGCTDKEDFDEYIKGVKEEAIYDTGITPEYETELICLSTCAYHTSSGREYLVGRRIEN